MRPRIPIRGVSVHPSVSPPFLSRATRPIRHYVGPSVGRSVGRSVGPSVGPSRYWFFGICERFLHYCSCPITWNWCCRVYRTSCCPCPPHYRPCPTARDDAGSCIRPCFLNRAKDVVYESFIIIENRYTDTREKLSQSKKWLWWSLLLSVNDGCTFDHP